MGTTLISFSQAPSPTPSGWDDPNIYAPATLTYGGNAYHGKVILYSTTSNPPTQVDWDSLDPADMVAGHLMPQFYFTDASHANAPPNLTCVMIVTVGNDHYEYSGKTACEWVQPPGAPYGYWRLIGENYDNTTQPTVF